MREKRKEKRFEKMAANAAAENKSDEEIMKQRVRENLKYLERLGISKDILDLAKREYKLWVDDVKDKYFSKRSSTNQNAGREYTGRIASDDQKAAAMKRAEELWSKSRCPSFIKPMVRSHVSGCFWLGLQRKFCNDNLPPGELRMILEDEEGKEDYVLYLGRKNGLSGGWRGFAMDHNLEDGDALLFELNQPARFKVHIMKAIMEESHEKVANTKHSTKSKKGHPVSKKVVNTKESAKSKKKDQPLSKKRPLKAGSGKQAQRASKRGRK